MPELLVRDLPARARDLADRLETLLAAQEDTAVRRLAASVRLGTADEPYRIVATGQYSAGKSMILRALTGDSSIVTGADVTTDEVAEYPWGDVVLVDTPGVQAGIRAHDEKAEQALRSADLVLFVVTVDLFDPLGARHLRHVAGELGKARDMVVVVNKSGTLRAEPAIRLGAVRQALGAVAPLPPVVICDALDYLDATAGADTELRADSGFDALPESMNRLVRGSGRHGRLRRPFDLLRAVTSDARGLLADDPAEETAWSLLSRQRRALLTSRDRVGNVVSHRSRDFRAALRRLADEFADALDGAEIAGTTIAGTQIAGTQGAGARGAAFEAVRQDAGHRLQASVRGLCDRFAADVEGDVRVLLSRAGAELAEIGSGPQAQWLRSREATVAPQVGSARGVPSGTPPRVARAADAVGTWAARFARFWGGDAAGAAEMPGTAGHRIVLVAGARLGMKFKPWQAVRVAGTVQTVARATAAVAAAASAATPVLIDLAAARAERARHTRRADVHRSLTAFGDVAVGDLERQVAAEVTPVFDEALAALGAAEDELRAARHRRDAVGAELDAIDAGCVAALAELEQARLAP